MSAGPALLRRRALLGAPLLLSAVPTPAAGLRVMGPGDPADQRYDFPQRLLAALLRVAGLPEHLEPVPGLDQRGVASHLASGDLDIAILPSVGVRQPGLEALRWPIRRGLLGARLLMALPEQAQRLRRMRQVEELKPLRLGYGADWHDAPLLEGLGFRLQRQPDYADLFRALLRGECDYLSRGVNEIWAEIDHPLLVPHAVQVVPGIALSYPLDDYFYVGERRRAWLPRLQAGLQALWDSGAYRRLFFEAYGRSLQRAGFTRRRVLPVLGYGVEAGTDLRLFDALRLRPTRASVQLPA